MDHPLPTLHPLFLVVLSTPISSPLVITAPYSTPKTIILAIFMLSSYSAGRQKLVLQMAGRLYVVITTPMAGNSSISSLTLKKPLRSLMDPCKTGESFALSVSPPEKNIGRSWQTLMKRVKVVIDSLPYVLRSSPQYSPLQFACDLLNSVPNSKFPFSSPHIIHQGVHNGYNHCPHGILLPFGTKVSTYKLEFLSVLSLPPPALTASFTHASKVNLATQLSLEQPPSLISSHHPHHHGNLLLVSPHLLIPPQTLYLPLPNHFLNLAFSRLL